MDRGSLSKTMIAIIGTVLTWLFGAWDIALQILIAFMVLDYATGLIKAYVNKVVSSNVGLKGIARKSLILIVLIVAVLLDRLLNNGTWVFRTLTCYFYIINEGISLLENCAQLGLPIPAKLKDALIQLQEGNKKEINNQDNINSK
ncbi:phage holin family protein [Clostridium tagluense]|uniref:phage holin family protein n=1 Tax=Clostridium tagluense TaxID=360422 RepID=UPI001CF17A7F|nr:phage holin family protein [Clostridium tagluense]MCB2310635.1 phage holin family protein [Clostridium tagluense]MCB2315634.1 phage holin family protein [Clostridium tagluense]MCB2320488.1 phage holin family protein [Clostridium tagluense]MCB2325229.1 phage holin family protein [Clostridium tagluense]MCB2330081.1 phage holin family protein [Clostridium tagluense]